MEEEKKTIAEWTDIKMSAEDKLFCDLNDCVDNYINEKFVDPYEYDFSKSIQALVDPIAKKVNADVLKYKQQWQKFQSDEE